MDVLTKIHDAFQDGDDTVKDAALSQASDEIERLREVIKGITYLDGKGKVCIGWYGDSEVSDVYPHALTVYDLNTDKSK